MRRLASTLAGTMPCLDVGISSSSSRAIYLGGCPSAASIWFTIPPVVCIENFRRLLGNAILLWPCAVHVSMNGLHHLPTFSPARESVGLKSTDPPHSTPWYKNVRRPFRLLRTPCLLLCQTRIVLSSPRCQAQSSYFSRKHSADLGHDVLYLSAKLLMYVFNLPSYRMFR